MIIGGMRRRRFSLLVAAAFLVTWHGVILSLPHTHTAEPDVPRFDGYCSVAYPGSHQFHIHPEGHQLPPHFCLACLVRSTTATAGGWAISISLTSAPDTVATIWGRPAPGTWRRLPRKRAPPCYA